MKGMLLFLILAVTKISGYTQVIISEIMADPSPPVGLPEVEYVEIQNTGSGAINLGGWVLADLHTEGLLKEYQLGPGGIVVLAAPAAAEALRAFSPVAVVSPWPSLNNGGDILRLISATGSLADSVAYSTDWYASTLKAAGGWSLEKADPWPACSGPDSWKASVDSLGGTPGRENSTHRADSLGPVIHQVVWLQDEGLRVEFSEAVDPLRTSADNFSLDDGTGPESIHFGRTADTVWMQYGIGPDPSVTYILTATNITDCAGNRASSNMQVLLPRRLKEDVWRINEVLFDPPPGGVDFVEVYNPASSPYLAGKLELVYRKNGERKKVLGITTEMILGEQEYLLLSEDPDWILGEYGGPPTVLPGPVPLFNIPDEGGELVLLVDGFLQDSVRVSDSFHHGILQDTEGWSLERTDTRQSGLEAAAWLTSSERATPGRENSQKLRSTAGSKLLTLSPEVVRPLSSRENVLIIQMNLPQGGITGTLRVYDLGGHERATITENQVLGIHQVLRWDVISDSGQVLQPGYYILMAEFYGREGFRESFMQRILVGR